MIHDINTGITCNSLLIYICLGSLLYTSVLRHFSNTRIVVRTADRTLTFPFRSSAWVYNPYTKKTPSSFSLLPHGSLQFLTYMLVAQFPTATFQCMNTTIKIITVSNKVQIISKSITHTNYAVNTQIKQTQTQLNTWITSINVDGLLKLELSYNTNYTNIHIPTSKFISGITLVTVLLHCINFS